MVWLYLWLIVFSFTKILVSSSNSMTWNFTTSTTSQNTSGFYKANWTIKIEPFYQLSCFSFVGQFFSSIQMFIAWGPHSNSNCCFAAQRPVKCLLGCTVFMWHKGSWGMVWEGKLRAGLRQAKLFVTPAISVINIWDKPIYLYLALTLYLSIYLSLSISYLILSPIHLFYLILYLNLFLFLSISLSISFSITLSLCLACERY